jgi:hypothetical protein
MKNPIPAALDAAMDKLLAYGPSKKTLTKQAAPRKKPLKSAKKKSVKRLER